MILSLSIPNFIFCISYFLSEVILKSFYEEHKLIVSLFLSLDVSLLLLINYYSLASKPSESTLNQIFSRI